MPTTNIFQQLRDVQARLKAIPVSERFAHDVRAFKARVCTLPRGHVLLIEHRNPGRGFALLDAAGSVFGSADVMDGCESCGFDSKVTVRFDSIEGEGL